MWLYYNYKVYNACIAEVHRTFFNVYTLLYRIFLSFQLLSERINNIKSKCIER